MTPDVSVIVAVYESVDLLPMTLASLERQSLGTKRVEVVLVDDGSTDGSDRVIDDFANRYPGPVRTFHQPNSGGPASPFNRGLELATGRYVFFLGSDDHLWDEALERLVAAADRWESDVVFGRIVGVDGHGVATKVYQHGNTEDLDLYATALPYALSNSKLFRRSLIESLGLRYREDMRQRCDQPFTLTAIVRGRKTSMLVDGDYYFARARPGGTNVTYTAGYDESLRSTEIVMDTIAELIEPGPRRDHVMLRQFDTSLDRLLDASFLNAAPDVKNEILERIGSLADRYLTDALATTLPVEARCRIVSAQRRDVEALGRVIDAFTVAEQGAGVPLAIEGDDVFLALPTFREPGWPDATFQTTRRLMKRVAQTVSTVSTSWCGDELLVDLVLQMTRLPADQVTAVLQPIDGAVPPIRARRLTAKPFKGLVREVPVTMSHEGGTVRCLVRIPASAVPLEPTHHCPRLRIRIGGFEYDLPIRALNEPSAQHVVRRWGLRTPILIVGQDGSGFMVVTRRSAWRKRRTENTGV